jgi:hypothetical protein
MSDFLSNLAATALHVMPIAQPRTPAIFEPRGIPANEPALDETESLVESSVARPRKLTPQIETRVEQHTTRDQLNTHVRSTAQHTAETTSRVEEQARYAEWQPATIVSPRMTPALARVPLSTIEPSSREEQSEQGEGAPRVNEETSTHISISPRVTRTAAIEMRPARSERSVIEPRAAGEPNEPRIHVSIGRIEVRATTSAAPTRTVKREAPILGLDDYLRQRR